MPLGAAVDRGMFSVVAIICHSLIKCLFRSRAKFFWAPCVCVRACVACVCVLRSVVETCMAPAQLQRERRSRYPYIYIYREREREGLDLDNKVQACFVLETFYSDFSPLRALSRSARSA